ncbi:hypothetical protein [uncultured Imperialibacter sp.]|uniref:hypothetical protein n=1 Tax=uncultured Imperialibacter sp. TaxID=1672639 RepID=UPI0030DB12FC|tara:strand:- start:316 stop:933 length:618 start_codon:yes stop_codon:yes gene_type:complete
MRTITIILSLCIVISCTSQYEKDERDIGNMKTVYFNHFNNTDSVFWTGDDGDQFAEISQGRYYFESLDSSARFNAPPFNIDSADNFLIELAITGPDSEDSAFYGLIFGNLDQDDEFIELRLNNVGEYHITSSELLAEGTYNNQINTKLKKLTVIYRDLDAHFLIDDTEIFKYPIQHYSKLRAGPITAKGSAIWMDFFKVKKETVP